MSPNYDIDGKIVKNNKINSNNVPGPGAYDPTDIEETHSPKYTISKTACRLSNFNNFIYSNESIKNSLNFSIKYLGLNESQLNYVDECFQKEKIIVIITSDNFDYKLKILTNLYNYSYYRDINNFIRVKILRYYSPDKFIKSLVNVNFFGVMFLAMIVFPIFISCLSSIKVKIFISFT